MVSAALARDGGDNGDKGDNDSVPPSKMAEARWKASRRVDGDVDANGDTDADISVATSTSR